MSSVHKERRPVDDLKASSVTQSNGPGRITAPGRFAFRFTATFFDHEGKIMTSLKEVPAWCEDAPSPAKAAALALAAALLASASAVLARLSARMVAPRAPLESDPRFEFYAEAGAPEGALYVDGRFVGWLPGVSRL
jgi:hypothetical protein